MELQKSDSDEHEDEENGQALELDQHQQSKVDHQEKRKIIKSFSEMQLRRYEQFRRSHLDRSVIKRCLEETAYSYAIDDKKTPSITRTMTIVMAGIAKSFVGDIVSEARKIMESMNEKGAIRPQYIREAYRRYNRQKGYLMNRKQKKRLF